VLIATEPVSEQHRLPIWASRNGDVVSGDHVHALRIVSDGPCQAGNGRLADMTEEQFESDSIDAELEDDGVLDSSDSLEGVVGGDGDDPLDEGIDAGDRYSAGERFGTTLSEEREGETFDQLLAEEEPDVDPYKEAGARDYGTAHPAGRLVAENEGSGEDDESELIGTDAGYDGGADSAEESAIHVIDEDNPTD
jgi:hypothetical protein